jgi:signal transduction histidine kinase
MVPIYMAEHEPPEPQLSRLVKQGPGDGLVSQQQFLALQEELRLTSERAEQSARELIKAKKLLNDWERQKNEMLSICAHDLKSPTSSILSFLDILRDSGHQLPPQEVAKIIERMDRAGRHMWALINDLLDSTHLESGKISLHKEPLLLSHLCKEVMEHSKAKADAKDIEISLQVAVAELKISLDHQKALQIINNLLSNALKFTPRGGKIYMRVASKDHRTTLEIEDSGQGIPPDELSKIFQKFQQTSTKATEGEKGSGLGLSIVQQLVELHDGKISVQSTLGKGTIFRLEFPVVESSVLLKLFSGKK